MREVSRQWRHPQGQPPGAYVHVLLVAPLGTGHMAQPGTDQHQSRVAIRKTAHHTSAATDLPVQPFNDIVGADTSPVLAGKIAVSQRFLYAILHLFGGLLQLHRAQLLHYGFGFLPGSFLTFLGVDRLEHFGYQFYLGTRSDREYIAVKVDGTALVSYSDGDVWCWPHTRPSTHG